VHARKLYSTAVGLPGSKYCTLGVCRHTPRNVTAAGAAVEYNFNGGRTHRSALMMLLLSWETVAT
jgi:hypothetical protein